MPVMTRKATAQDMELKLRTALQNLEASKLQCKQLLQENDESEEEVKKIVNKNSSLKRELVDLHHQYLNVVDERDQLKVVTDGFSNCCNLYEEALSKVRDLEDELIHANSHIIRLEKEKECTQIYKGLDVVTAKASAKEREMATHHLLDILEPHQMFTVVDFRNRALKIIDTLAEQGKMPIVVGGTNYYIESIVYKILVEDMDDNEALLWEKSRRKRDDGDSDGERKKEKKERKQSVEAQREEDKQTENPKEPSASDAPKKDFDISKCQLTKTQLQTDLDNEIIFTNEEMHAKLDLVDPKMAKRLHPNNRRKIMRSIEVFLKTGRRHSEILAEQKITEGQLRRPGDTVIFWLKCEKAIHDQRLNARVDSMIEEGLIKELLDFHDKHNKQRIQDGKSPDYTKGVFQTLGFKEFHEYLMLSDEEKNSGSGKKLLKESIENMKMGTRRYARRQNKMIRGRFLEHPTREVPPIYELDTTDVSKWDDEIKNKAIHILESFLNETPCDFEPLSIEIDEMKRGVDGNSHNHCDVCNRIFIGDNVYAIHLKSIRHNKVLKKKKRLEELKRKMELMEEKKTSDA